MASRVEKLLNIPVQGLWIGTFHGICVRILRREAERWGFSRDFTIYDRDDQLSVIKKAMREMGLKKDRLNPSHVINTISKAKNDFISPDKLDSFVSGPDAKLIESLYSRYEELLKSAEAFDFDDLIIRPVEKFKIDSDALAQWRNRFSHILVDEYQDTNRTQYLLMKLLSGDTGNITVVGDDDQSIYSWRGANVQNILGFESDFKDVKTVRLEQNYRSTGTILEAANAVVSNNIKRMSKRLWTDQPEGPSVKILECRDDMDEAERVISSIESETKNNGYSLNDCVILYRTNAQSRAFEDVLRRRGIKYVVVGGLKFYERKEIKDILAYLRIIVNPNDTVSFARAATTPKRSIGDKTIEKLVRYASENGISITKALAEAEKIISAGVILTRLKEFHNIVSSLSDMRGKSGIYSILRALIEAIGYEAYLKKEYPDNYEDRINNVNELLTAMGEFENPTEDDDLSTFLAEVSLVSDIDTWEDDIGVLTLMTLHSAKGLEFRSVHIAGVERGLFPLPHTFLNDNELEEERRLFYVGITRSKENLSISYAEYRSRYSSYSGGESMFIDELPEELLTFERRKPVHRMPRPSRRQAIRKTMEFEDYSQEPYDPEEDGAFSVGSYVRHPAFGRGCIMERSGNGKNLILTINFGKETKKIVAKYTKLIPA